MKGRLLQLDILRAVAIIMVLGCHMPNSDGYYEAVFKVPGNFGDIWARSGWAGVDLFFVLSGFLVSGLLFKEYQKYGDVNVFRFLVRRGFKIYPAFYCLLLTTLAVQLSLHIMRGWEVSGTVAYVFEAFFIQNYGPHIWPHTWSLAVEEHFYLTLGLGIYLLTLMRGKSENPFTLIPRAFIIIAPTILIIRLLNAHYHPYELFDDGGWRINGVKTHLRFDSLFFGVLLSYWMHFHQSSTVAFINKYRWPILVISPILASLCLFISCWSNVMYTFGFTVLYLGFGGILLLFVQWDIRSEVLRKAFVPLGLIGYYSYSIYLWHYAVLKWSFMIQQHFLGTGQRLPANYEGPLYFFGSLAVGMLMAKIVEMPFLRLRDRFFPSRSGLSAKLAQESIQPAASGVS